MNPKEELKDIMELFLEGEPRRGKLKKGEQ
jgi:hypothetical protein